MSILQLHYKIQNELVGLEDINENYLEENDMKNLITVRNQ